MGRGGRRPGEAGLHAALLPLARFPNLVATFPGPARAHPWHSTTRSCDSVSTSTAASRSPRALTKESSRSSAVGGGAAAGAASAAIACWPFVDPDGGCKLRLARPSFCGRGGKRAAAAGEARRVVAARRAHGCAWGFRLKRTGMPQCDRNERCRAGSAIKSPYTDTRVAHQFPCIPLNLLLSAVDQTCSSSVEASRLAPLRHRPLAVRQLRLQPARQPWASAWLHPSPRDLWDAADWRIVAWQQWRRCGGSGSPAAPLLSLQPLADAAAVSTAGKLWVGAAKPADHGCGHRIPSRSLADVPSARSPVLHRRRPRASSPPAATPSPPEAGAQADAVDDPATAFDWKLGLALAGCAFEVGAGRVCNACGRVAE